MKYVIGVIRASDLEKVREALGAAEIYRLTVGEVEVFGPGGSAPPADDERRVRVEIAVNETFLKPALDAFKSVSGEGEDEGWVTVLPLEDALRIRTGETGPAAI